jgi:hypothetical protein
MRGFEGFDTGDRVRVELIGTDVEPRIHRLRPIRKRAGGLRFAFPGREMDHYDKNRC